MDAKLVKVARLGGEVREFALEDGENAQTVLDKHGIATQGFEVRVSGGKSSTQTLSHGDIITLVKEVRGGEVAA